MSEQQTQQTVTADPKFLAIIGMSAVGRVSAPLLAKQVAKQSGLLEHEISVMDIKSDGSAFLIQMSGRRYTAMMNRWSTPSAGFERAIKSSVLWKNAAPAIDAADSHFLVSPFGPPRDHEDNVGHAVGTTLIAAALTRLGNPMFVYWVSAQLLIKPDEFVRRDVECARNGALPVLSWFTFEPKRSDGGPSTVLTHGLRPFLGKEVAVIRAKDLGTVLNDTVRIVEYVLKRGDVILDGEMLTLSGDCVLRAAVSDLAIIASDAPN